MPKINSLQTEKPDSELIPYQLNDNVEPRVPNFDYFSESPCWSVVFLEYLFDEALK